MFEIRFQGLRIEPTLSASRELIEEGKDLYDVLETTIFHSSNDEW